MQACFFLFKSVYIYIFIYIFVCVVTLNQILAAVEKSPTQNIYIYIYIQFGVYIIMANVAFKNLIKIIKINSLMINFLHCFIEYSVDNNSTL